MEDQEQLFIKIASEVLGKNVVLSTIDSIEPSESSGPSAPSTQTFSFNNFNTKIRDRIVTLLFEGKKIIYIRIDDFLLNNDKHSLICSFDAIHFIKIEHILYTHEENNDDVEEEVDSIGYASVEGFNDDIEIPRLKEFPILEEHPELEDVSAEKPYYTIEIDYLYASQNLELVVNQLLLEIRRNNSDSDSDDNYCNDSDDN